MNAPSRIIARVVQDLRLAVRAHLRTPALTFTIVFTLALGLGASLASFSLVDAMLLRTLGGVERPDELVRIGGTGYEGEVLPSTSTMVEALAKMPAFAGVCHTGPPRRIVEFDGRVSTEPMLLLSGGCFDVLRVKPHLGRLLTRDDERERARVVVATHAFWVNELGGRRDAIGRTIKLDGEPFTLVGVTGPDFTGVTRSFPPSLIMPIVAARPADAPPVYWADFVVARRAPGVSLAQARAQLDAAWPRLLESTGMNAAAEHGLRERVKASRAFVGDASAGIENAMRPPFQQPLLLMLGLSVLILVICGANAASLLVTRSLARRREQAMRLALGATRVDVVRQSSIETLLPVLAGAAMALPLANGMTTTLLNGLRVRYSNMIVATGWDARILAFLAAALALITLTTVLAQVTGRRRELSLADALRASARATHASHGRSRRALVAVQVALTVVLIGSAGTFVRSLQRYYAVDVRFSVDAILSAMVTAVPGGYARLPGGAYYEELLARVEALPGVRAASLTQWMPLGVHSNTQEVARLAGTGTAATGAIIWPVSDHFFDSVGVALKEGRTFDRAHRTDSSLARTAVAPRPGEVRGYSGQTAVLSESLARRLFPTGSAIGGRVRAGRDPALADLLVIGVVADARLAQPQNRPEPILYLNYWEDPASQRWPGLLVRTDDDHPERLASAVAGAVRAGGREFVSWMRTTSDQRDLMLTHERLLAGTSAAFGIIGLIIAAAGLFGLLSHYVASRRADIAIRVAVGASRGHITRLLAREVAGLVAIGALAGLLLLQVTSSAFTSLLFGAAPGEPWLVAATLVIVGLVAAAAVWVPLRRALATDPLIALRSE